MQYLGGSSLQCLCIFVDLFLKQKGLGPVSQQFRFGMRHVSGPISPMGDIERESNHLN